MRKLTYRYPSKAGAAILSAAMLLSMTACNTANRKNGTEPAPSASDSSDAVINITEPEESTSQPDDNSSGPVSDSQNKAYSAYLTQLDSLKEQITGYTWMTIGSGDSNWLFPEESGRRGSRHRIR